MSGGGGGTAPTYLQTYHQAILEGYDSTNTWASSFAWGSTFANNPSALRWIIEYGLTDVGGNPYTGVSSYNPDIDFSEIDTALSELNSDLDNINPSTDWGNIVDVADAKFDEDMEYYDVDTMVDFVISRARSVGNEVLMDAVNAVITNLRDELVSSALNDLRNRQRNEHSRAVNKFVAPMADVNAVNSSAFAIGMAILEKDYEDRIAEIDTQYTLPMSRELFNGFLSVFVEQLKEHVAYYKDTMKARLLYDDTSVRAMIDLTRLKTLSDIDFVKTYVDAKKSRVIAKTEEYERNLAIDVEEGRWDLSLLTEASNILGNPVGAINPKQIQPTRVQTALSTGLGFASVAAAAGTGGLSLLGVGIAGAIAGYLGG